MSQPQNVIVISNSTSADFAWSLMARWQLEREVPAFTLLSAEFWDPTGVVSGDVAIIAPLPRTRMEPVLRSLAATGIDAVCLSSYPGTLAWARSLHPRALVVPQQDCWAEALVEFGGLVLARMAAEEHARQAERLTTENQLFATLGRYMVEMRHAFNNAMTPLLGNAELLLMEPGTFSAGVREQLKTIRAMALRLHQMMQRFSSLEAELEVSEEDSQTERHTLEKSRVV